MKIAIASDDQIHIAAHFGRVKGFVIAEIEQNQVIKKEYRQNIGKHTGECGSCDHDKMIENIKDCAVVISYGMGHRIFNDLSHNDIEAVVTDVETVEKAIEQFMQKTLQHNPEKLH